jgi:hypothetical protein
MRWALFAFKKTRSGSGRHTVELPVNWLIGNAEIEAPNSEENAWSAATVKG